MLAACERREDADLAAGVDALHVGGRVFFGIALFLRQTQRRGKVHVVRYHFTQNEVGGSVEDAGDLLDTVGGKAQAQRTDDRDPAADGRFKQEIDIVFAGEIQQHVALFGHKLLVGRHHMLALFETRGHKRKRRLHAAHRFHNDPGVVVGKNVVHVFGHILGKRAVREIPDIQNMGKAQLHAAVFCNVIRVACDHLGNTGADHAEAHDCNVHVFGSPFPC